MDREPAAIISPKVSWGAAGGLSAALALAALTAILADPSGLGFTPPPWGLFLLAALGPVVVQTLTGYLKRDPLRTVQAITATPGDTNRAV